jgi:predicted TIM-barrel fold metal-dependent hydrolase
MLLPPATRAGLMPAERLMPMPIPPRIVSNGEYLPPPQSRPLKAYQGRMAEAMAREPGRHGMAPETWLASPHAMATAFAALGASFGGGFRADDAADPEAARARRARDAGQFVFDDQVHFIKDDADPALFVPLTGLIELSAELLGLPHAGRFSMETIRFAQFLRDIYLASDTRVALLSGAPGDDADGWMLSNDQMAAARAAVNRVAGGRRLLTHAVIAPGHDGWLDEIDRVIAELKPDGWKGYTVGEPFGPSRHRWRLDDEALMYPAYEKMVKAGVRNLCIHKGLLPADPALMPGAEPFAMVDDLPRAARDWPQLNFIIYHAAYRTIPQPTEAELVRFETSGRIDWVSDLAEIPAAWGVGNVYADIGASFAFTVLTHPRLAAAMIAILARGLGADHVLWGTDSVWYGSPQWQIEALRRLEMPADLMDRFGLPDIAPMKPAILGLNAAPLYGLDPAAYREGALEEGQIPALVADWQARGGRPSHLAHGWVSPAGEA